MNWTICLFAAARLTIVSNPYAWARCDVTDSQEARERFDATDHLFDEAGESLTPYLAHCQSLCATPAFLWSDLSGDE